MVEHNIVSEINKLEQEILEKKKRLVELKKAIPDKQVENYLFQSSMNQEKSLLELFDDKDELWVVHNMGKSCGYCTMWADGFNSVYHHLDGKAAFVVSSPDTPEVQESFAASRKWQFPMVSIEGSAFTKDMGFEKEGYFYPGVSTFYKDEQDQIFLHSQASFGPGDDYCVPWHLFDLLPSGREGITVKRNLNSESPFQLTNNIAVGVTDYDNAVQFYENVLGMQMEQELQNEKKFSASGTNFYFENASENDVYFEFAVDDFEAAKRLLLANGCTITKVYSENSCMFADPYGLRFHVFE
ncbi:DUF899 family protein [Lentibacillus sediminis]|uniref:DUF899 family protein n=1 Tax=Lentibacillus sediminis TaxID=1940529 RepID=UPI000C1BE1A0|nr:DUF899 family protein [Lentibacillus sediminis]